ncbi:hypothetical protein [uncultured Sanguibacteroides sp.]|uniref:hypothetical protein n=1 Tax=uncultured Sanguibacteroides sp. TaxID=1635151 RepID=UPI0025FDFF74|nr:hypothetical protein [uncultured Sanguibacteroides sp.]
MNWRDLILVAVYELKQQSRSRTFLFFVLLALIGVVGCHAYWQGWGNSGNWKMVALPCSMPLVNAYLFGVVQSVFLIVMLADVPRRLARTGAIESLYARPVGNATYYWGVILGNLMLFLLVDIVVITVSVLAVNLASLAPLSLKYYLFYLLTLTIPSWVFVGGLTLWLSYLFRSRVLAMVIPVCWLVGSIFWLPYQVHGTLDYMAGGIPNLFSGITGHVNPCGYLLHRLTYFLAGTGLLVWSAGKMKRLSNGTVGLRLNRCLGVFLVIAGLLCGMALENSYYRDRQVRTDYRDSFRRNWQERTCRVRSNAITLRQEGRKLKAKSELTVYNPGREVLDRVVLVLNPGLRVTGLRSGGSDLAYRRDHQFILIDRPLGARDSLRVQVAYEGKIDDRFCDLHLRDTVYENPFSNDRFFATGRRGAFVEKELLLLTPASAWYPVAIPPVNPFMPMATGRDFTRFRLEVEHPLQKEIISQGQKFKAEGTITFVCHNMLNGISLCGANYQCYTIPLDEAFGLRLSTETRDKRFVKSLSQISQVDFISWKEFPLLSAFGSYRSGSWYEPETPYLNLLEVPVSFRSDSHAGKPEAGLVEPGMIFLRERGFDMNIVQVMAIDKIENEEVFSKVVYALYDGVFFSKRKQQDSHPLMDLKKKETMFGWDYSENDNNGSSLNEVQRVWVHALRYPFMGKIFEELFSKNFSTGRGITKMFAPMSVKKEDNGFFIGRSLTDILSENEKVELLDKLEDLWIRLTLDIPGQELRQSLDSLYRFRMGEVDYDSLLQAWSVRWGVNVEDIITDWITTKNEQYFKVRDAVSYFDPASGRYKTEGMIMNAGKYRGIVSIEYGPLNKMQRSVCCLEPGEVKAFVFVTDGPVMCINTGLSANRPAVFTLENRKAEVLEKTWELIQEWRPVPVSEFLKNENPNEFIVDDQDAGFEVKNGNLSWFQKGRKATPLLVGYTQAGGDARRWQRVIDADACGDAIRGYHYIGGGSGKSTATWRADIPEAGRYRVMGKVYRVYTRPPEFSDSPSGGISFDDSGIIYYYTLSFGEREEKAEVSLDAELSGSSGWALIGEYDLPAGEVSVTLSDKEVRRRKEVAIVADAVKFIKLK